MTTTTYDNTNIEFIRLDTDTINVVKYLETDTYNSRDNITKLITYDSFVDYIHSKKALTEQKGILEMIDNIYSCIYIDFEGVQSANPDDDSIMLSFVNKFIDYYNLTSYYGTFGDKVGDKYVISKNLHSKHPGLSYHIFIPVVMKRTDIKLILQVFLMNHKEYIPYVDVSVYSSKRLFRVPECMDPAQRNGQLNKQSIHHISYVNGDKIDYETLNANEQKDLIRGCLAQVPTISYITITQQIADNIQAWLNTCKELRNKRKNTYQAIPPVRDGTMYNIITRMNDNYNNIYKIMISLMGLLIMMQIFVLFKM